MKFSGHETFHIREGWLFKGLTLLDENPSAFKDVFVYDRLGVGSNMARSIRHWLQVTSLVDRCQDGSLVHQDLARVLRRFDPYFEDPFTWWILHIELVCNEKAATSWHWFFNYFGRARFDKESCLGALQRYARAKCKRSPSPKTLERDVSTVLSSYSRVVPVDPLQDPEDSTDCPLQELGLLTFFRETGTYTLNFEGKEIPPEALGYCLGRSCERDNSQNTIVAFDQLLSLENSPSKCFCLTPSDTFEIAERAAALLGEEFFQIGSSAGKRTLRYRNLGLYEWIELYFRSRQTKMKAS